jgi:ABC-type nitrate/sulfonate/bicarbonate transport system permease component
VPSVALIPLAVLIFGAGLESKWFLAAFAATWPILLQTLYGVRDVDPVGMETARSFGIKTPERLRRVVLPSALPYIATGVRISSAVALILAVTAELVLGAPGLGQQINIARQSGAVEAMYALIIATGLIGWGLNILLSTAERRVLHWHASQRERNR